MVSELPILHVLRRKNDAKAIRFELGVPAPGSVCAITQDSISDSELDFLPGCVLDKDRPEHRCMKLQCGHEFSAMHLVYYWARSRSVLCPMCRGGPERAYLDLRKLPCHFGPAMTRKVRSERRKDTMERRREDEQAALMIQNQAGSESPVTGFLVSWVMLHSPEMLSLRLVRRFAVLGQDELNHGVRLPCDVQWLRGAAVFSCRVRASLLADLEEFKMFGAIRTDDHETKFPETEWCEFGPNCELMGMDADGEGVCYYSIARQGQDAVLKWTVMTPFFNFVLEHHQYVHGLMRLGLL